MSKVDMEREEVTRMPALPEELVERILALVPFPYVFKARALSKSWLARYSPVSLPHDDEEKRLAISFQRRMAQDWSTKWPTFCPVFICKENLMAYDWATRRCQRLPSVTEFLHKTLSMSSRQMQGALLLTSFVSLEVGWRSEDVYVANVLTQSWKQLPPCPRINEVLKFRIPFCDNRTLVTHTETFKVIEIYPLDSRLNPNLCLALIYDSKEDAWKRKTVEVPAGCAVYLRGAYFNGAVYWLIGPHAEPTALLAFNVDEETFQVLQLPTLELSTLAQPTWDSFNLVVGNGSLLLLVLSEDPFAVLVERVIVIKVDLESRRWLEVTRGPPSNHGECVPASDSDCVYFVGNNPGEDFKSGYEYNVKNDDPSFCITEWPLRLLKKNEQLMLVDQLYPLVDKLEHDFACDVTGMLFYMGQTKLVCLIESTKAFMAKVAEVMEVLQNTNWYRQQHLIQHQLAGLTLNAVAA